MSRPQSSDRSSPTPFGPKRRKWLIRDLLDGKNDIVDLAEKYGVSADELAAWIAEPANQRCLAGLCTLADVQTQLMLSRWRHHAANRLIRYATDKKSPADMARRACVDLLKQEMKRADRGEVDDVDDAAAESLRALLSSDYATSSSSADASPRGHASGHADGHASGDADGDADGDRRAARHGDRGGKEVA